MSSNGKLCPGCMNDSGGEKICPICGYDSTKQNADDCLPIGFVLGKRYMLGQTKHRNGEAVTYIGWDNSESSVVTVREYFPAGFAVRNSDKSVGIVKGGEYTFNEGLIEYIDINRQIKESPLPSQMPITDVFEENGTVYTVTQSISAITLSEFLAKNGGTLKWEQARPLFLPLIDTIKGMNDLGIIHGGISTDTILVGRDGKLRISGYSIKNLRLNDSPLESVLFHGFAAIEQYDSDMHTDTYTDVYGLCAVLFAVLMGNVPPRATERLNNDSMTVPAKFAEELPRHVLSALANGLQVLPQNRTQNIEAFKNELVYAEMSDSAPAVRKPEKEEISGRKTTKKRTGTARYVIISSACTAAAFFVIVAVLIFTVFKEDFFGNDSSSGLSSIASVSAPSVAEIGSVDSGAEVSDVLYTVPRLVGKYYADLADTTGPETEIYEKFEFVIKGKEFNDTYPRGQICAQSVAEGTGVVRDTKIELTISLGPKEIKIANVLGLDETNAKLELLKQGFLYDNIEVAEKYDEDHEPGTVLEQDPKYGTQISADSAVKIYINSYMGNTESEAN